MQTSIASIRCEILNVSPKTNWTFVAVTASDGVCAWGEASLNAWEPMLRGAIELVANQAVGLTLEAATSALRVSTHSTGGLVHAAAISATLQALLELQAVNTGQDWPSLLGPLRRARLMAYANINRATTDRRPDGFAATARRAMTAGYRAFKAAPFDGLTPVLCGTAEGRQRIRHGVDCMMALRDAIGPEARLMVDCHWRFDEARAKEVLSALLPARLHWFECPLPETTAHWSSLKRVRSAANDHGVLLAAAETQVGCAGFQPLFDAGLYDVVMPDVKYCGGPWEMLRIAERARNAEVQFSPHNPSGPIASLHSLVVAGVALECDMIELQYEESELFEQLIPGIHPLLIDGALAVPTHSSRRVMPDAALFAQHPYQPVPLGVEALAAG